MRAGYDALGDRYLHWSSRIEGDPRQRFLEQLEARVPDAAPVLDVGCGPGVPWTRDLAERYAVTGIDISESQIALARENAPAARLLTGDVCEVSFPGESFAAITALYSLTHVPREEHGALFARMREWLRPRGVLLITLGVGDDPGSTADWLGVPMFFSGHDADTSRALLCRTGFELLHDEVVEIREPEGPARFLWLLAIAS